MDHRKISLIARDITTDWSPAKDNRRHGIYFKARPYLEAMHALNHISDRLGYDTGRDIVTSFLTYAHTYRGDNARRFKQELKEILKNDS